MSLRDVTSTRTVSAYEDADSRQSARANRRILMARIVTPLTGQRTEDRGQRSEVRGERSEVRGQTGLCPLPSGLWPLFGRPQHVPVDVEVIERRACGFVLNHLHDADSLRRPERTAAVQPFEHLHVLAAERDAFPAGAG